MESRKSLKDLPITMAERAKQARLLAASSPDKIELDDEFLPWVFDENEQVWLSFDGNYSGTSPTEKRIKAKEREAKQEEYKAFAEAKALEEYEKNLYWSKIREDILQRDNHTCQVCGDFKRTPFNIHHILKRREGGTDHYDNLITVCNRCHGKVDSSKYYDPDWSQNPPNKAMQANY